MGFTKKGGNELGCICHEFKPSDSVSVFFSGPVNVRVNDTAIYKLRIANGPAASGGCDIAVSRGNIFVSALDTSLRRDEQFPGAGFELTHRSPKLFTNDTLTFTFRYVAPNTPNVVDTLFANGNSTNNDTNSSNDLWNYADNFPINITPLTDVSGNDLSINSFKLYQNYPNPFNPETKVEFEVNKSASISLILYDANGKEITKLIDNKSYKQGEYSLTLNALQYNLSSGVYFYKLVSNEFEDIRKMMFLK